MPSFTFNHILGVRFNQAQNVFIPEWICQPTESNTYLWNLEVETIEVDARLNDEELFNLLDLFKQKITIIFEGTNESFDVWLSNIDVQYDTKNMAKPWRISATFLCV